MVRYEEYRALNSSLTAKLDKLTREYHESINAQKAWNAKLAVMLAEAQSNLRYKDRIIAEKEVEIDALKRRLQSASILGRSTEETQA